VNSETGCAEWSGRLGGGTRVLLLGIEAYRLLLSPLLGGHCRFWPSCSAYAEEALRRHGAGRGTLLAVRRVLRCHPFHRGGVDLVP
jgi:putative membrane protein insertion efficiency factor